MLAQAASALALFAPVIVHDADERHPFKPFVGDVPAAYARAVPARAGGEWLQYWLWFPYQDQDRGIVRTGRHEGDWELVQYRVQDGRLREAVYAQHAGAERCAASEVERRDGRPVVYAAHGSHASYLRAGTRDRFWPDPNDEADGRGVVIATTAVPITRTSPDWMTKSTPWGDSRAAGWNPLEQDSPHGPYFQPARWDANAFADDARDCQAHCDEVGACDAPEQAMTVGVFALLGAIVLMRRRWRRKPPGDATA